MTAKILENHLSTYVNRKLDKLADTELDDFEKTKNAIKSAFLQLDNEIISDGLAAVYEPIPHAEAVCRITPAESGSCALLTLYNPKSSTLHVANAGDSRAVLARPPRDNGTEWTSHPLSVDHTATNADEIARINAEHPGEDSIFRGVRFLGCQVTRSFGDNLRKWPTEALEDSKNGFFGRNYLNRILTPPYETAEPDVQSIQVQPGDVLIIASDGFWSHLSNEDAVHCVKLWMDARNPAGALGKTSGGPEDPERVEPSVQDGNSSNESTNTKSGSLRSSQEEPQRPMYPYDWEMEQEAFIVEHDNIATHLARNALGGNVTDLFRSVMSLLPPKSKEARDDMTVMVVVF